MVLLLKNNENTLDNRESISNFAFLKHKIEYFLKLGKSLN